MTLVLPQYSAVTKTFVCRLGEPIVSKSTWKPVSGQPIAISEQSRAGINLDMAWQSENRRWRLTVIVTIAALAALTTLTADVSARQAAEATAPREAGEPIMAIVSIKSQQVTFYDADGWILSA